MSQDRRKIFTNRYEHTERPGVGFVRMLLVWHGSAFKLIWFHLLIFISAYALLSILYRNVFIYNDEQREAFELICIYCSRFAKKIPVTFMIGFYIANVVSRYWDQFISLPWPDRIAYKLVAYIPGTDDYARTLRRTVIRLLNLSTVLVFRTVSPKVLARFPTYQSMVDAGLMVPDEVERLSDVDGMTSHETSWAPFVWAVSLLQRERKEERLKIEGSLFAHVINSFEYLEVCNRRIFNHGWVTFPFAYSQVITLTVYTYLFANLFGDQYLEPSDQFKLDLFKDLGVSISKDKPFDLHTPVIHVPIFTLIEFIAYLGWIKVAETLLNPWGDDDEDFQINYLIDRNFQTSLLIVDNPTCEFEMQPDAYFSKPAPSELPYNDLTRPEKTDSHQKTNLEDSNCLTRTVYTMRDKLRNNSSVSTAAFLRRMNERTKQQIPNEETEVSQSDIPLTGMDGVTVEKNQH